MKSIRTFNVRPFTSTVIATAPPDCLQPAVELGPWRRSTCSAGSIRDSVGSDAIATPFCSSVVFDQSVLDAAAKDDSFLAHMNGVVDKLDYYLQFREKARGTAANTTRKNDMVVAYFSAEFGITECLSIFAGGSSVCLPAII